MTYGKEDVDYRTDGDASSGYVFNGAESVIWRRIRYNMNSQLSTLYQSLDSSGCWSSTSLINQFDAWQSQFPEELWRLDIERKYYRTYQGGGLNAGATPQPTQRYLKEMMNGRKKYQRRQFERDQEVYMGTKYLSSTIMADQIMFRCNTPSEAVVAPSYDLTITPYSDMYLSVKFGNISPVQIRAKANTQYTVTCPLTDNMDDTAFLIYAASHIKALNDLSACYIHDNDFSKATKLQTLKIGNTTTGYNNAFLTTLNMGNNALLTSLDIRNCGSLAGSLNLSSCGNLEKLYAQGTILSSVIFANYGKVDSVYLPATIKSLTMKNLAYLTTLNATYNVLEELVKENGVVDEYAIVQNAYDTLNSVRLVGINWTMSETTLLNSLVGINDCYLAGTVTLTGQVRQRELDNYAAKWADLTVIYEATNIVPQYILTYKNADGTVLGTYYADQGSVPPNPVSVGVISANPTLASDAQYVYTFSGWNDLVTVVSANRNIVATYTTTTRTYTVTWYANNGDTLYLDRQTNVAYGSDVSYSGSWPTKTSEEATLYYNLFTGWDKSTGFVKSDLNVYAVWDRKQLPAAGTDLSDMTPGQIYAIKRTGKAADYFTMADYTDIVLGRDYTFSNVSSETLITDTYYNGTNATTKEIYLFGENSETSFTMAIDFRFTSTTNTNGTLVSLFDENGAEGFRLRYNNGPNIQWGDTNYNFGYQTKRDIVVLRHQKGSNKLYIYASNANGSTTFSDSIVNTNLTRARATTSSNKLTFGAIRFTGDGGFDDYGIGTIYWCKVWYDDLGETNCKALASWPHEKLRMEYFGAERYRLAGNTSQRCEASFISNALLADRARSMNGSNTNAGGWDSCLMRTKFMKDRLEKAFPEAWQSMIESVKISASAGSQSTEILVSEDKLYLPCAREVDSGQSGTMATEGEFMSGTWFTGANQRIKFMGFVRDNSTVYSGTTEPSTIDGNDCQPGDVWNRGNTCYILMTETDRAKNGLTVGYTTVGGLKWVTTGLSIYWWLRSPYLSNSTAFWDVNPYGNMYGNGGASIAYGVCPGFSI